jgi:hypothetical protein
MRVRNSSDRPAYPKDVEKKMTEGNWRELQLYELSPPADRQAAHRYPGVPGAPRTFASRTFPSAENGPGMTRASTFNMNIPSSILKVGP